MTPIPCTTPLDAPFLADYYLAALDPAEESRVEEHLFTCDSCGVRLDSIIALAEALRALTRSGSLSMIVPQSFLESATSQGLHISEYAPPAGGSVQCTVTAADDLLIGRLAADLTHAGHLDLSLCDPTGAEFSRLSDIPFNPATGDVIWQQSIAYAKAAPSSSLTARLISVDDTGHESLLGEYTFYHTRTLPGPAAW
jgi:Putative zinc-finger